jgi:hypothetical protein
MSYACNSLSVEGNLMWRPFETVTDPCTDEEPLRRRRFGCIETIDGRLRQVTLQPFPKLISVVETVLFGRWFHRRAEDRCLLYYSQPWNFSNFLAVKYVVSGGQTRMATLHRALDVLEEIARLKRSDAILCDVANRRITDRMLGRRGFVPHCPSRWHRHFIKRLYSR